MPAVNAGRQKTSAGTVSPPFRPAPDLTEAPLSDFAVSLRSLENAAYPSYPFDRSTVIRLCRIPPLTRKCSLSVLSVGGRAVTLLDNSSGPRRAFEYVSLTDRMVWFWNEVAARVTARVPDARLAVYAYSCYKAPPLRETLHPSLAVGFVGFDYASDAARRQARADWDAWSRATGTLYWRPNLLLFARREGTPALYARKLGEDFAYVAKRSLKGTDFDSCAHHWATEGLNYYVLARLLWRPDADVDALVEDYCRSGFGKGWRQVREYFTRIEAVTDGIAAKALPVTAPYTPERVAGLDALLGAALEADEDETVRRRVAFLRRGLKNKGTGI